MSSGAAVEHKKPIRRLSMSGLFGVHWNKSKAERKVSVATRIESTDVLIEEANVIAYEIHNASPKFQHTHVLDDNDSRDSRYPIPKEDIARNALNREIRAKHGTKVGRKKGERGGIFESFRSNRKPPKYISKSKEARSEPVGRFKENPRSRSDGALIHRTEHIESQISPLTEMARARKLKLFEDGSPTTERRSDSSLSPDNSPRFWRRLRRMSGNSQTSGDESDSTTTSRRVQDLSTIKVIKENRVLRNGFSKMDKSNLSDDDGISSGSNTPISVLVTPCPNSESDSCLYNSSLPPTAASDSTTPSSPSDIRSVDRFPVESARLAQCIKKHFSRDMDGEKRSKSQESLMTLIVKAVSSRNHKESSGAADCIDGRSTRGSSPNTDADRESNGTASEKGDDEVFASEFTTWEGREAATLPRPKNRKIGNLDNLAETKDKESPRDFTWHAVKTKNKKGTATSNTARPQSMMISKLPTTYGNSLSNNGSYFSGDAKVHGLPVRQSYRPATAYDIKPVDAAAFEGRTLKGSYKDDGDSSSLHSGSRTPPHLTHLNNHISGSVESLDEAVDLAEFEYDPDLVIKEDEPEAWSVTVDKKVLSKMHKKDIIRQENIFEFIQKERNFLTTLKIMQKVFAQGMSRELHLDQEVIERMFPQIDEFVEFTSNFVQHLLARQQEDKVVSKIGDVLLSQWSGESGRQMMWIFGEFCSKQQDIVNLYKDMMKNDKKFQDFVRNCSKNKVTRRRDIPGCILLVTQRITKYPVILKTLIDNSKRKEHKYDSGNLNEALELITEIITKVDKQVLEYEKKKKVEDIHQKIESKSYATYKDGRKFTREDFQHSISKLLQVGTLQWKPNTVKRPIDVTVVLFKDLLVFLQESNQKYSFASVGQPAAVPLHKLIVREKAGEEKVLFILSASSDQPEMYELEFQTPTDSKSWMQHIRAAVDGCPEEDEGVSYQDVEEQRLMEKKWVQAQQLIGDMEKGDKQVNDLLQEKMEKFKMLAKVLDKPEVTANMSFGYPRYVLNSNDAKNTLAPSGAPILQKAIEQVNKLAQALCGPGGLNRNPSSVGEHDSGTYHQPSLPKRSETFGGFDNGKEPPSPRSKWATMGSKPSSKDSSSESRRDSGVTEVGSSIGGSESQISGLSGDSLPNDSASRGQGMLLPPTSDQISALAQLTHLMNEYLSVATQQDTQVQKMSLKMIQSQNRRRNGNQFLEVEARRNQAKQTEMEQDLTKREEQLKSERDQWEKKYRRFQASMEEDEKSYAAKMEKLKFDEIEVQRQQEELKRQKEECQRQMARLRELQRRATSQDPGLPHSTSYPSSLANRNNSNSVSPVEEEDGTMESIDSKLFKNATFGQNLGSMAALSKSHSSLEGELSSGENSVSKESSHSPTYTSTGDYPKTFPGTGKHSSPFIPQQQHHSVQPPVPPSGQSGTQNLPLHLQYSASNQLSGHMAPLRHSVIPSGLSSKSKHGSQQVLPSKLKGALAGVQSLQSSSKQTFPTGLKGKLPFSHKKTPRVANSSSDLIDAKTRSNTLTVPNNLKHSKSEANMEVSNNRDRSKSSPSPVTSLYPPDSESGLERSNSASSNSSKEGTEKKKKNKRRSWGSNGDKQTDKEKEIYF